MGWEEMWDDERKRWVQVFFKDKKRQQQKGSAVAATGTQGVVLLGPDGRPLKKKQRMGFPM